MQELSTITMLFERIFHQQRVFYAIRAMPGPWAAVCCWAGGARRKKTRMGGQQLRWRNLRHLSLGWGVSCSARVAGAYAGGHALHSSLRVLDTPAVFQQQGKHGGAALLRQSYQLGKVPREIYVWVKSNLSGTFDDFASVRQELSGLT